MQVRRREKGSGARRLRRADAPDGSKVCGAVAAGSGYRKRGRKSSANFSMRFSGTTEMCCSSKSRAMN